MYRNETINKLQATINAVWNNEYNDLYQTHWRKAGITTCPTITSITELQQLPPVNKDFFITARTKGINTFTPPQKCLFLNSTTGSTTGEPFFLWEHNCSNLAYHTLRQHGARRMFFIWNYSKDPTYMSSARSVGIEVVSVDPHQLSHCEELLQTETFNALEATPSIATLLPQHLKNIKLLEQIKVLFLSGETLTPVTLQLLRQQYPTAQIFSYFSCTESGGHAALHTPACGEDHSALHVIDEDFIIDCNDSNELAITTLNPHYPLPLIRYQTGDNAVLLKDPCACGLDTVRFKITGRSEVDFVRIRGMEIRIEYLQAALAVFSTELKPVLHVTVREIRDGNRTVVLLNIALVLYDSSKDTPSLRERILHALNDVQISRRVTLKQAIEAGLFTSPKITFNTNYEIKNKNKSIKLVSS